MEKFECVVVTSPICYDVTKDNGKRGTKVVRRDSDMRVDTFISSSDDLLYDSVDLNEIDKLIEVNISCHAV